MQLMAGNVRSEGLNNRTCFQRMADRGLNDKCHKNKALFVKKHGYYAFFCLVNTQLIKKYV
jgi:hypothetical protein